MLLRRYANQSDDWPDVQLFLASASDASDGGVFNMRNLGVTDAVYSAVYEPILYHEAYSVVPLVMRPLSRGTVRLRSADMRDPPLIDPRYLHHPRDVEVLVSEQRCRSPSAFLMPPDWEHTKPIPFQRTWTLSRAEQGRTGQSRAGQSRAGQGRGRSVLHDVMSGVTNTSSSTLRKKS